VHRAVRVVKIDRQWAISGMSVTSAPGQIKAPLSSRWAAAAQLLAN